MCNKKVELDKNITSLDVKSKQELLCYQKYEVPKELYGYRECKHNDPNLAFPIKYIICLKTNGIVVTQRKMCLMMSEVEFYKNPFTLIEGGIPVPKSLELFYELGNIENKFKNKNMTLNDFREVKFDCLQG
tara:strand:- start:186 stop:578 length:393 start_codon:yes stop_codon:yes gene_type:complete